MNTLQQIRLKVPPRVQLIAVSKGQPAEKIRAAYYAGQIDFGENYAQELSEKAAELHDLNIHWHFLGHLQKNKINKITDRVAWLHSLDSLDLAEALSKKFQRPLQCLIEVKLAQNSEKTGVDEAALLELIPKLKAFPNIDLKGLMTIPPLSKNPEDSRPIFQKLFRLLKEINRRYLYEKPLTELSMGMSNDFEIAIEEGATMVRVGTAIFGEREIASQ